MLINKQKYMQSKRPEKPILQVKKPIGKSTNNIPITYI